MLITSGIGLVCFWLHVLSYFIERVGEERVSSSFFNLTDSRASPLYGSSWGLLYLFFLLRLIQLFFLASFTDRPYSHGSFRLRSACSSRPAMYLPRQLISHLYLQLLKSHHPLSPPVLILAALDPDSLCACRILTALLKRDYIPHKIQPVAGYGDLSRAGEELVKPMKTTNGGSGGVVVCLGVGGLVDLSEILALTAGEGDGETVDDDMGGVEVWVFDSRRPWNLGNVFGGEPVVNHQEADEISGLYRRRGRGVEKGCINQSYASGRGGIVVYDDGDIEEELAREREAYCELFEMPEVDDDDDNYDDEDDGSDAEDDDAGHDSHNGGSKKRKSWSGREDEDGMDDMSEPPHRRRRSNSVRASTKQRATHEELTAPRRVHLPIHPLVTDERMYMILQTRHARLRQTREAIRQ